MGRVISRWLRAWLVLSLLLAVLLPGATPAMAQTGDSTSAAPAPDQTDPADGACAAQVAAQEQVSLRARASEATLQGLRDYRAALDDVYLSVSQAETASAIVDVASLVAGWPIGKAVEDAVLGNVKNTLTEKLIKAGFKSIEKKLLKDPTLSGVLDQTFGPPSTSPTDVNSPVALDVTKEAIKDSLKQAFDDETAGTIIGFVDIFKAGKGAYVGMKRLQAIEAMIRNTDDQILAMQDKHQGHMDMLDDAANAVGLCLDGVGNADNWRWQNVRGYLGLPEASATNANNPPPPPTASEKYWAFNLEGIGLVLATDREIAETPACQWNGGGPRPCPGAGPAKVAGKVGGPYDNSDEAFKDLKTKLECFNGYWGPQAKVGDKNAWLQNNIGTDACKVVKSA